MTNVLLFVVLPYVALFTFLLVSIQRYRARKFTYSSLSSQFLENQQHFWSLVPFHYGIVAVLAAHLGAFLFPRELLAWNGVPVRLYLTEITGLALGLLTLIGLGAAIARRFETRKVRRVTSPTDWVLYILLAIQIVTGVAVAILHPWGSSWFAVVAAPYLWSLFKLNPNITAVAALPWLVQLHIVNAWVFLGFFPFTRLVHVLVAPNPYLWRKPQVVRWYRSPEAAR